MSEYIKEMRALIGHRMLLLAGANIIVTSPDSKILLQHRLDGSWGLPGGLMEPGESFEETAKRELLEETGILATKFNFLNVFSGSDYTFTLPNKDNFNVITALYWCNENQWFGEIINQKSEAFEVQFFEEDKLPKNMDDEYETYLNYYFEHKENASKN